MTGYTTGTVTFTNGSDVIIGVGTAWLNQVFPGDWICRTQAGPFYEVISLTDTQVVIDRDYEGVTEADVTYYIVKLSDSRNRNASVLKRIEDLISAYGTKPATTSGTANDIVLNSGSSYASYGDGISYLWRAISDNDGAMTVKPDDLLAAPLLLPGWYALSGGEVRANGVYCIIYDAFALSGTGAFILINPSFPVDLTAIGKAIVSAADGDAVKALLSVSIGLQNLNGGSVGGLRNVLQNPVMELAQRGASVSIAAASAAYLFDRWRVNNDTNQTMTVSQETFSIGQGLVPGRNRKKLRINFASTPTTGTVRVQQRIDNASATLVAYVTGPGGSETLAADVVQNFGSGGSPSGAVTTAMTFAAGSPETIYDASTQRRSWGVTIPSVSGKVLGTNGDDNLEVGITLTPRQSGNYELARISFGRGDMTSETDPAGGYDFAADLVACRRFFRKSYDLTVAPGAATMVGALSHRNVAGANLEGTFVWNVDIAPAMRKTPTVTLYSPNDGATGYMYDQGNAVNIPASAYNIGVCGIAIENSNPFSGGNGFGSVHYTADCEF